MNARSIALFLVLGSAVGCSSPAASGTATLRAADTVTDQPANFALVMTGIYRGGHPDTGGLQFLQNLGVITIVDLEIGDLIEATPGEIQAEIAGATTLGINDIREPMSAFEPAISSSFDAKIGQILAILANPAQQPVYVHCAHGQDRTGLVIGLERVVNEGWSPAAAWDEMLAYGFHTGFLGLDAYFFRKTGWNPVTDSDDAGSASSDDASGSYDAGVDAGP